MTLSSSTAPVCSRISSVLGTLGVSVPVAIGKLDVDDGRAVVGDGADSSSSSATVSSTKTPLTWNSN